MGPSSSYVAVLLDRLVACRRGTCDVVVHVDHHSNIRGRDVANQKLSASRRGATFQHLVSLSQPIFD